MVRLGTLMTESRTKRELSVRCCLLPAALLVVSTACAAEPRVLPPTVELSGPAAAQRLLVLDAAAGTFVGDRTAGATFASSNPAVATVDQAGVVRAAGDGEAVITA